MARRTLIAAVALLALVCVVHAEPEVEAKTFNKPAKDDTLKPGIGGMYNGGKGCVYVNPDQVVRILAKKNDWTSLADYDTTIIEETLQSLKNTNNYVCKKCKGPNTVEHNTDAIFDGYSECRCNEGYGFAQFLDKEVVEPQPVAKGAAAAADDKNFGKKDIVKVENWYGCVKCPEGFTTFLDDNTGLNGGPYWTGYEAGGTTYKRPSKTQNNWVGTLCLPEDQPKAAPAAAAPAAAPATPKA